MEDRDLPDCPPESTRAYHRADEADMMEPKRDRAMDMKRKGELFAIAQGIAAQLQATTNRRERCFVRAMVEALLEG